MQVRAVHSFGCSGTVFSMLDQRMDNFMPVLKRFRLYALTRVVFVLTIALSFFNIWDIHVASAACTIQGTVYVDYNSDGVKNNALEPGQANITVTAYGVNNAIADTATTANDGSYTL